LVVVPLAATLAWAAFGASMSIRKNNLPGYPPKSGIVSIPADSKIRDMADGGVGLAVVATLASIMYGPSMYLTDLTELERPRVTIGASALYALGTGLGISLTNQFFQTELSGVEARQKEEAQSCEKKFGKEECWKPRPETKGGGERHPNTSPTSWCPRPPHGKPLSRVTRPKPAQSPAQKLESL
jgi:hypothetical protein